MRDANKKRALTTFLFAWAFVLMFGIGQVVAGEECDGEDMWLCCQFYCQFTGSGCGWVEDDQAICVNHAGEITGQTTCVCVSG